MAQIGRVISGLTGAASVTVSDPDQPPIAPFLRVFAVNGTFSPMAHLATYWAPLRKRLSSWPYRSMPWFQAISQIVPIRPTPSRACPWSRPASSHSPSPSSCTTGMAFLIEPRPSPCLKYSTARSTFARSSQWMPTARTQAMLHRSQLVQ